MVHSELIIIYFPQSLVPLYVYQARMSLFERVALVNGGVDALSSSELLRALSMATCLDARPHDDGYEVRVQ